MPGFPRVAPHRPITPIRGAIVDQTYRALGEGDRAMSRQVLSSHRQSLDLALWNRGTGLHGRQPDGCDPCGHADSCCRFGELQVRGQGEGEEVREAAAKVLGRWLQTRNCRARSGDAALTAFATAERVTGRRADWLKQSREPGRLVGQPNNYVDAALARRNLILGRARSQSLHGIAASKIKIQSAAHLCLEGLTPSIAKSSEQASCRLEFAGAERKIPKQPDGKRKNELANSCMVRQKLRPRRLPALALNDPNLQVRIAELHAVEEIGGFPLGMVCGRPRSFRWRRSVAAELVANI